VAESLTQWLQTLADASPQQRLKIANYLKKAGFYTGKVTENFNTQLITAVSKAEQEIDQLKPFIGDMDRTTYYVQKGKEVGAGAGGDGNVTRQRYISNEQTISKTLDDIAKDLLGRALTDKEKSKYAKRLMQEQRKASSDVVTAYSGDGMATTTGGLDEGQFLIDQISQTDEAKANRVLEGYDVMMRLLGGLR
jgi:hypothetical protein